jgi:hypothetical protein
MEPEEAGGMALPVASVSADGRHVQQEGTPLPEERDYPPGVHDAVDATEAQRRMSARDRGSLPEIGGGLTDPGAVKEGAAQAPSRVLEAFDPLGGAADPDAALPDEVRAGLRTEAAPLPVGRVYPAQGAAAPAVAVPPAPPPLQLEPKLAAARDYLAQRIPVQLELQGGTMVVKAIDVQVSPYGVTILLPSQTEGVTFIPDPGSNVVIQVGEDRIPCFFPGAYADLPELAVMVLSFVKADTDGQ